MRREPRTPAGGVAAAALASPLMLVLARTVYGGMPNRDPAELLDGARTGGRRDLKRRFRIGCSAGFLLGSAMIVVRDIVQGLVFDLPPGQVAVVAVADGIVFGGSVGLAAGTTYVPLSLWEGPLDFESVQSPADLIRTCRRTALAQALVLAPVLAVVVPGTGWAVVRLLQPLPPVFGEWHWDFGFGLLIGAYAATMGPLGYVLAMTAWGRWPVFGRLWPPLTGRLPWAVPEFLDDAYRRGVFRRVGVVYQFRRVRLQHHLADVRSESAWPLVAPSDMNDRSMTGP